MIITKNMLRILQNPYKTILYSSAIENFALGYLNCVNGRMRTVDYTKKSDLVLGWEIDYSKVSDLVLGWGVVGLVYGMGSLYTIGTIVFSKFTSEIESDQPKLSPLHYSGLSTDEMYLLSSRMLGAAVHFSTAVLINKFPDEASAAYIILGKAQMAVGVIQVISAVKDVVDDLFENNETKCIGAACHQDDVGL